MACSSHFNSVDICLVLYLFIIPVFDLKYVFNNFVYMICKLSIIRYQVLLQFVYLLGLFYITLSRNAVHM